MDISLRINGEECALSVPASRTLLEALRDDMALTGAKNACNQGVCGSCTVLVDGMPVNACLVLAVNVTGRDITTIEGLGEGGELSVVQQAFVDAGAIQCGFCMSGMIVSATAFLAHNPMPSRDEIRTALSGNLCRCSGYVRVFDAVALAAQRLSP
ncbi:MAG: (2Fe-2S)-binding protein [Alphaproteobacteria bacterium]|jgi:carbon-monoxide dehydrogenase small subunit|nr:(2Fe-2S)-binding protein [Alphaproteobacteria bacterium]MDP6588644.1 (2Fe-2S)-binding protein [Alphaproteobacteria bacterium]MDP6816975.1 (2Fe-2S)-binding protein [Alphaproteobacteria bacterium]|tara:strand:- start:298 stop:762 length:465 start_codon:yes stop_codon:yes gene_type:complete